jgi:hypothetical protein
MISPDRVTINGTNAKLFEIEDSIKVMLVPVGVEGDEWEVRTNLPLKNTTPWSKIPGSDPNLDNTIYGVDIYVHYVDKYDSELDLSVQTDYHSAEKLLKSDELITGNVPIVEYNYGNKSYKYQKAYFDHIDGAVLDVRLSWAHKVSSSDSGSSYSSSVKSSSNTNWDKVLDEFESYVNQCIKAYKKAEDGGLSELNDYLKLEEKADELAEQLEDAEDELTEKQITRYIKITEKMLDAIFE